MADRTTFQAKDIKTEDCTSNYYLSLQEAEKEVKQHSEKTGNHYTTVKAHAYFGKTRWNLVENKLLWEEGDHCLGERLQYDGIPFLVLATKQLLCHYGITTKKANCISGAPKTKDLGCPAKVILKEVIKFPDYKIESNTYYEKKRWSNMLRDDIPGGKVRSERRIYVHLPSQELHRHTVLTKKVQENVDAGDTIERYCLICNSKISASSRSAIPLFTGKIVTTHRRLELSAMIGGILNEKLHRSNAHSSIMCSKCFSLIDDIDSLEEQVINKKQIFVNKYKKTMLEVAQRPHSPTELFGNDDDDDKDPDFEINTPNIKRGSGRGRGRPPGRSKTRGRGRGQKPQIKIEPMRKAESVLVKLELEETPDDIIQKIPIPVQNIKKEDIMSETGSDVDPEEASVRIEAFEDDDEEEEVELSINKDSMGEMMIDENVLEAVGEVLEKESKQGKRFPCSKCGKRFHTKSGLKNHLQTHDSLESYDCEECEKSFSNKYRLKAHLKIHVNRERPYQCNICKKTFYTRYYLNSHMKGHEGGREYICEHCGKSLSTQKTLELHILTHTGEKPYQCEICGSTFRQRSNLLTHIKATHYHEKNYHCELCQRSFVRRRLLEYHMNSVHTGQRPYKCEMCNATFVYPHYFNRHMRKHTGDKPHKCPICEKTFSSRENRNAHMFIHSDKKPYECKMCSAGFMRKPMCVTHLAVHGQISNPESYITFNSPSLLASRHEEGIAEEETTQTIHAVTLADEETSSDQTEEQTQIIDEGGKVMKITSRPVHIIETDETTRYVIHSTDRAQDSNMEHFFAELQAQVEVRSEDF